MVEIAKRNNVSSLESEVKLQYAFPSVICRTVIFMVIPVLILPQIFEMSGVGLSITVGETLSILMRIYYFLKYRTVWRGDEQ